MHQNGEVKGPSTMRKYYKLLLLVITALSVVFLLFYKTQYDKLYGVLQVMEFFGEGREDGRVKLAPVHCSLEARAPWSPPSFHPLSQETFVYSAFCQTQAEKASACSIVMALAVSINEDDLENLSCQLW